MTTSHIFRMTTSPFRVGRPACTRRGDNVRIICIDAPGPFPIVGLIDGQTAPFAWTTGGWFTLDDDSTDPWDLVNDGPADGISPDDYQVSTLLQALGAHFQADAYRDAIPDDERDESYLRRGEEHWRRMASLLVSSDLVAAALEAARLRAIASCTSVQPWLDGMKWDEVPR